MYLVYIIELTNISHHSLFDITWLRDILRVILSTRLHILLGGPNKMFWQGKKQLDRRRTWLKINLLHVFFYLTLSESSYKFFFLKFVQPMGEMASDQTIAFFKQ